MELVSIIIPIYNVEQYIEDCINSVINQTYDSIEVVIVNDGSKDRSREIAEQTVSKGRFPYKIVDRENRGVASARNTGIHNSSGDWLITVDGDDILCHEAIEIAIKNKRDSDVVFFGFELRNVSGINNRKNITKNRIIYLEPTEVIEGFYARKYMLISPGALINRKLIDDHNLVYDEDCRFAEDDIFVWKLLLSARKSVFIDYPMYVYVMHDGSTMTSSTIDKYISVKRAMEELERLCQCSSFVPIQIKQRMLPRRYFGVMHAASKTISRNDFIYLVEVLNLKKYLGRKGISLSERIAYFLTINSPGIMWMLLRKI